MFAKCAWSWPRKSWKSTLGDVTDAFIKGVIDEKVEQRTAAKAARDFATADRIRDELKAEGILLEDGAGGTTWRRV